MECDLYHPWRELRARRDVWLWWTGSLPVIACTDGAANIWITEGLGQAARRVAITHELIHLERGHVGLQPRRVESEVEREVARRLITDEAWAAALAWTSCEWELAEELWVTVDVVRVRKSFSGKDLRT